VPVVREVVGTFTREKYVGYVIPSAKKKAFELFIPKGKSMKAKPGDKVMARVTRPPRGRTMGEGEVVEIIGRAGEPGADMKALVRAHGITVEFPRAAIIEAREVSGERDVPQVESGAEPVYDGRRDLRGEVVFTIDGADARDFDDAVSVRRLGGGNYLLGVHIADVTHYVREDGALDREALARGTSVYLPDFVVPMLPEALSNGICSLNEGVDRLTLSVDMEVGADGAVARHEIYESVIRSRARLVYDDVSDFLEMDSRLRGNDNDGRVNDKKTQCHSREGGNPSSPGAGLPDDADVRAALLLMRELADILAAARERRGSIDFDLSEPEITLDADGAPVHVGARDRRVANRLIEEFMLLANETVATEYFGKQRPFVYRVHARPDAEKMRELAEFLRGFDIRLSRDHSSVRPADLAGILKQVEGRPEENIVSEVILRSMQKAEYSADSTGHFGLALRHYCHFTSPIRRYPDLFIHRVIKEDIRGWLTARRIQDLRGRASRAALKSSLAERTAVEAEREADRMKMAEYMALHLGERFPAVVSGVTSFGIFCELENTVEGLIRMRDLDDDYYEYSEEEYLLRGRLSGREIRLGDRLDVIVKAVDIDAREIDFAPA
jgi:ribonuclease R